VLSSTPFTRRGRARAAPDGPHVRNLQHRVTQESRQGSTNEIEGKAKCVIGLNGSILSAARSVHMARPRAEGGEARCGGGAGRLVFVANDGRGGRRVFGGYCCSAASDRLMGRKPFGHGAPLCFGGGAARQQSGERSIRQRACARGLVLQKTSGHPKEAPKTIERRIF